MKPLDLILLVFLAWGAYKGYKKGLLVELIGTLLLIFFIVLGFKFFWTVDSFLKEMIGDLGGLLPFITFLAIAAAISTGLYWASKYIKKVLSYTLFGSIDKGLGAILGLMKNVFLAATFFWVIGLAEIRIAKEHAEGTYIYPAIQTVSLKTVGAMGYMMPYFKGLKAKLEAQLNPQPSILEGKANGQ